MGGVVAGSTQALREPDLDVENGMPSAAAPGRIFGALNARRLGWHIR